MRPEIAPVSQTNRLRSAMAASGMTHRQTVRADIEQVEVSARALHRPVVYFCGIRGVRVRETIQEGDGGPLPSEVTLAGLEVTREGFYDILDAVISSNGRVQVALDGRSRVVPRPVPDHPGVLVET